VAEGAPLLRAYRGNFIEGSNPSLSAIYKKPDSKSGFLYMAERDCLRSLRFERSAAPQTAKGCPNGVRILAQPKPESIPLDEFKHSANPKHFIREVFSA
jgi:hypothetical protein